ncbi:MAG: type II toxin-antitoxin system RelE/ParE family toxin [Ignavibacteriales bacterium]|nr:type II toxin-antitoxin system RelE/ParE family toxin [Ignavibacteriales bacterium]
MESKFRDKFYRDVDKIHDQRILDALSETILNVEQAKSLREIQNIKKMKGSDNAYRIKVKEYRLGIFLVGNVMEFTRFLHRKEIYRFFP